MRGINRTQSSSQTASFLFLTEVIFVFTVALYGLPNIPFPIPQEHYGGTTLMIQLSPTRHLPQHMGIMGATIQDEIWVGA